MVALDDTETSLLLMLAEEAEDTGRPLRPETIASRFRPPMSSRIVDLGLRHLKDQGLVEAQFDNPRASGYLISRRGLEVVRQRFERRDIGGNTEWNPIVQDEANSREGATSMVATQPQQPLDSQSWTGAQLTLVSQQHIADLRRLAKELRSAVHSLHFQSNSESANLKGLADALVSVSEMAEPEITLIERILASPKFKTYATLFGIIATIRGAIGF